MYNCGQYIYVLPYIVQASSVKFVFLRIQQIHVKRLQQITFINSTHG